MTLSKLWALFTNNRGNELEFLWQIKFSTESVLIGDWLCQDKESTKYN